MDRLPIILFQNTEGKVLLQYRDSGAPTMPLKWSFFGGRADSEEETVEQAILREIQEELGIELTEEELVFLGSEVHTEDATREIFVFTCTHPIGWDRIEVREGAGAAFLSKQEILAMRDTTETAKYFVGKYL